MRKHILKNRKAIFLLLVVAISSIVFSACEKRWEDMNTDPNRLKDLPDEYLFTSAVRGTFTSGMGAINVDFGGQYSHIFLGSVWKREVDKYSSFSSQSDFPEQIFNSLYQGPIRTSLEAMLLTSEGKYQNEMRYAQCQIINVINFARISDLFGDIPYFEGGRGKYGDIKPKYDKQEVIYDDIVSKLNSSIDILKDGNVQQAYPTGIDPIYDGDVDKWVRMANSFRLRLALRGYNADQDKYSAVISECLSEVLIEENDQNATLTTWDSDNGSLYNPWYNNIINLQGGIFPLLWGEFFIDLLKSTDDPRLPFFATKNMDEEYIGMPNGLVDNHPSLPSFATWDKSNTSQPTEEFFARDQPLYLIAASEIWLLRAEAAIMGLGQGDANEMYRKGIEFNMQQWGIDQAMIDVFMANQADANLSGSAEDQERLISTQLYISFVPNTVESWNTIRRTGYPKIPQRTADNLSKGVTNGFMPIRINYPATVEGSVNGDNLQEAINRLGGTDRIDLPVWWGAK